MVEFLLGLFSGVLMMWIFAALEMQKDARRAKMALHHVSTAAFIIGANSYRNPKDINNAEIHLEAAEDYLRSITDDHA